MLRKDVSDIIEEQIVALYGTLPTKKSIRRLTKDLTAIVMDPDVGLDEIGVIDDFEEEADGLEETYFFYLANTVIELIPADQAGTKKLYDYFVDNFEDIQVYARLMNECREFLSDFQYKKLKALGACFDEEILKIHIPDWEEL